MMDPKTEDNSLSPSASTQFSLHPSSRPPSSSPTLSLGDERQTEAGSLALAVTRIFSRDPVILFLFATFAIITNLFYTTDFRDTLENFFYDTRTKWMPASEKSPGIIVIAIDDPSIAILEKDQLRARSDNKKRPYLSVHSLTRAVSVLANTDASAIALLMPEHAFPASDLDMEELRDIVKYDQRMVIGTTGYNQTTPNLSQLPGVFADITPQVSGYETFRSRSNAVVRSLPYTSFRGLSEIETLPVKVAEIADRDFTAEYGSYLLKYEHPEHFPVIPITSLIERPMEFMESFKNKVVVVGYTVSRDAGFQTTEQMMANTPLTGAAPTIDSGISTTWLTANAIENLLTRQNLITASGVTTLAQTIAMAVLCGFSWELGSLAASIVTIASWLLLLTAHSFMYRYLSVTIPLADTFLATVLVSIFAATRKLKSELKSMADKEASTTAKAEIAAVQSDFLAGFASWLMSMTGRLVRLIRQSSESANGDATTKDFYQRAFAAGEDFGEYLEAIRQIPEMESLSRSHARRESIDLPTFVETLLRRFEIKTTERGIRFVVDIAENARVIRSNPQLLDAIIFNFVSNAVKYGPDKTPIAIKIRRLTKNETTISVIDRGPGIPPELRERIFERFYRIRDDRMYKAKGSGLGLYLCRFFAENLGGRVEVLSEVGVGSEFRVVLP